MNGIGTITQKGQVVIPKPIRQLLGLEPLDRLYFEVKEGKILARPIRSIEEAMGIVRAKKTATKREYKKTIAERLAKKYS